MFIVVKLIVVIFFVVMIMIVFELFKFYMFEGYQFGYFIYMNGVIVVLVGWKLIGGCVGYGVMFVINNGVMVFVVLIFVLLFIYFFCLMIL